MQMPRPRQDAKVAAKAKDKSDKAAVKAFTKAKANADAVARSLLVGATGTGRGPPIWDAAENARAVLDAQFATDAKAASAASIAEAAFEIFVPDWVTFDKASRHAEATFIQGFSRCRVRLAFPACLGGQGSLFHGCFVFRGGHGCQVRLRHQGHIG
jgi:hypothetical protein